MTSAVFASRNEEKWVESKGVMKNWPPNRALIRSSSNNFSHFTSPFNQIPNPTFNASFRQKIDPLLSSSGTFYKNIQVSVNLDKDLCCRKFDLGSYSIYDLKMLKSRLISELRRVRHILKRIESLEIELRTPRFSVPLLPPFNSDIGKSEKVLVGKKRVKTAADPPPVRMESKRRAVGVQVKIMRKCREALMKLMNLKSAVYFSQPVDVQLLQLPDYYSIIKRPMDLGTIKLKLEKNGYRTPKAFADDVRLTFDNAMLYNHKGSKVYISAQKLLMRFQQLFDPIANNCKAHFVPKPLRVPKSVKEMKSSDGLKVQRESIKPISKSRDINKRDMRMEEKQQLGKRLQEIPPEVAAHMVHILRGRNPSLMLDVDEIMFDVNALDVETLWELERFVANYKNQSKMIEEEQVDNPASVADLNKHSAVIELLPDDEVELNKKVDELDEDVDIGEEVLMGNFPSVEIEKDVPGANSSGSSSSGSSSDSDSLSATDSDSSGSSSSDSEEDSVQSPFVKPTTDAQGLA